MTQETETKLFQGFKVIKLKCSIGNKLQTRDIFVQEHKIRRPASDKPAGRTLFLVNLPPYMHENELKWGFKDIGDVQSVILSGNVIERNAEAPDDTLPASIQTQNKYFNRNMLINNFKTAYLVFKSTKSLQLALQKNEIKMFDNKTGSILCTGIEKWTKEYNESLINEKDLENEVNEYMKWFEVREHIARENAKKTEVDEDGWVTVKRGKNAGFEQKESILKALEEKIEKGKKRKEFDNFYTFQIRESKQKHIVSLRKKFQEDKLKIEALKKARRFKPF